MNTVIISNTEYHTLYNKGGDTLVAILSTLRLAQKGKSSINLIGRKKATATLKSLTSLSIPTIQRYLPILIKLGMVSIQSNGNIQIRSIKYNQIHLTKIGTKLKLMPMVVEEKLTSTKTHSFFIRLHSNISCQQRRIERKGKQSQLLKHHAQGKLRTLKEIKRAKALIKKGLTLKTLNHCSNTILSNQSFDKLRRGQQSKQCGNYHKKKLRNMNLIRSYRNKQLMFPNLFSYRALRNLNESVLNGKYFIGFGGIYFEGVSTISIDALVGKKKL